MDSRCSLHLNMRHLRICHLLVCTRYGTVSTCLRSGCSRLHPPVALLQLLLLLLLLLLLRLEAAAWVLH